MDIRELPLHRYYIKIINDILNYKGFTLKFDSSGDLIIDDGILLSGNAIVFLIDESREVWIFETILIMRYCDYSPVGKKIHNHQRGHNFITSEVAKKIHDGLGRVERIMNSKSHNKTISSLANIKANAEDNGTFT